MISLERIQELELKVAMQETEIASLKHSTSKDLAREMQSLQQLARSVERYLWSPGGSITKRVEMQAAWNEYRSLYPEEAP